MSDKIPPLCDQPKWNHIRHRCCCVFDHDSDKNEPLAECYYHERIRARLADAVRLLEGWHTAYHADAGMEGLDDDTTTWLAGISPFTPDSADVLRTPDDPLSPHYDPTHTETVDGVKT